MAKAITRKKTQNVHSASTPGLFSLLARSEGPTRADIAHLFVKRHANDLRFDHQRGKFLHFSGSHWQVDRDRIAHRLVMELVAEARRSVRINRLEKVSKFVKGLATASGIAGVLEVAKSTLPVSHPGGGWDRNPLVAGAPNGVIDLATGLLMKGKSDRHDHVISEADSTCQTLMGVGRVRYGPSLS